MENMELVNTYRIYTGPTIVKQTAARLREVFSRVLDGTEHVFVYTTADEDTVFEVLTEKGKYIGWNRRDIQMVAPLMYYRTN